MWNKLCAFLRQYVKQAQGEPLLQEEEESHDMDNPPINRELRIDLADYISLIEGQNFTNGYRIRFMPVHKHTDHKLNYTAWWYKDLDKGRTWYADTIPRKRLPSRRRYRCTRTSLHTRKAVQTTFVEFGKWYGAGGNLPKDTIINVEITVYTPEGDEIGTGTTTFHLSNLTE